jgi:hypothetical protein
MHECEFFNTSVRHLYGLLILNDMIMGVNIVCLN